MNNDQASSANQPVHVYRGIHSRHIKLADARAGIVAPGDPHGDLTATEHNALNESAVSPFTSWTYSIEVARRFASHRGPGGIVLRLPLSAPRPHQDWSWHQSPDVHREQEILLKGVRIDAEVLEG